MNPGIHRLVDLEQAITQRLSMPVSQRKNITLDVLRIDKIHATISGNKWFKLRYALQEALQSERTIVTFGGAFSNHLLATAFSCARLGLRCVGIIRGEEPLPALSPTLLECNQLGMQLHFISREEYGFKELLYDKFERQFPGSLIVPEGGASSLGVQGAADILSTAVGQFTHICCSVGTGTMIAGLVNSSSEYQFVMGFSALKIPENDNSIEEFINEATSGKTNYRIWYNYHFGGYARKNTQLLQFMNDFHTQTGIPTDFVYTGKLCYGVLDLIEDDQFPTGSQVLIIHSGGLQGNRSLPKDALVF